MKTILIADDSWIARRGIGSYISSDKWRIVEAENGKDALSKIEEETPDLVLLDLLMPEMGGLEVLEKLAEKELSPPVIVLSADIQNTTKRKCLELGAVRFLKKPPKRDDVLRAVEEILLTEEDKA